jgi:phosphate transport system substrate-binding protein
VTNGRPVRPPATRSRSTRRALLAGGAALLGSLAGCAAPTGQSTSGPAGERTTTRSESERTVATATAASPPAPTPTPTPTPTSVPDLVVGSGSTLYPIANGLAGLWNRNPAPAAIDGWSPDASRGVDEARRADRFAARAGFEPTGERGRPPFRVETTLTHSRRAAEMVAGEVADATADVTGVAPAEVVGIYAGEIENWRAVGGPDREIRVLGGAEGSQPTPLGAFLRRRDAYGTGLTVRYGRAHQRIAVVGSRDDAVAPVPVGVAERALLVDGDASVTTRRSR